jgi:tRNA(Ile)-lysidine synthase
MREGVVTRVRESVRALLAREARVVLAVSGGVDSMSLLDAVVHERGRGNVVIVATVDHGSGPASTEGAAVAAREAARHGLPVRTERLVVARGSEAAWREARWRFLRAVALAECATIVTAHTRDDQIETVVMRILRGAGMRGLAGLFAGSGVARPLLEFGRAELRRYAAACRVPVVDDPTNVSRAFLRNRVRLDLLPALRRVVPDFERDILDLARRAAEVRRSLESVAGGFVVARTPAGAEVDATALATLDPGGLRLVWQAIAGAAGLPLDRRGIVRLERFTRQARVGTRVQVSGGAEVVCGRGVMTLRRTGRGTAPATRLRPREPSVVGRFRFRPLPATTIKEVPDDPWHAVLPEGDDTIVRPWAAGDRMVVDAAGTLRRVKRFFADARIPGPLREGWPVVVVGGQIVWIPGVRRGPTPTAGHRTLVVYHCEPVAG